MRLSFPLDRVLAFRRLQADLERAALEKLAGERAGILAQIAEVDRQAQLAVEDAARNVSATVAIEELGARQGYFEHLRRMAAEMARVLAAKEAEMARQRQMVMETERRYELIKKLKDRKRAEWDAEIDKRFEELAADAHRSRMHWSQPAV